MKKSDPDPFSRAWMNVCIYTPYVTDQSCSGVNSRNGHNITIINGFPSISKTTYYSTFLLSFCHLCTYIDDPTNDLLYVIYCPVQIKRFLVVNSIQWGTDWFSNGKPRMDGSHLVVPPLGDNEDHPDRLCSGWIWKRGVIFTTIPGKLITYCIWLQEMRCSFVGIHR